MILEQVLSAACPGGHHVDLHGQTFMGRGTLSDGQPVLILGIQEAAFLGIDDATVLSAFVLQALDGVPMPILVVVDSRSQRMTARDELLGLSQFLSHLAQSLLLADLNEFHTVGVLYGQSAAGAFIATALATRSLLALPGAQPAVMDLPSMARVTKLSLATLEEKAKGTPVFAPGLDNLAQMGAVLATVPVSELAAKLVEVTSGAGDGVDRRDRLGAERGGRPKAAEVALAVYSTAVQEA